jgi:hypothetical protein
MRTAALVLAAALLAAPSVLAQATPPPTTQTQADARQAAAQRLMAATGAMAMAGQMLEAIQQQLVALLTQLNPGKGDEVQGLVADVLMPEFRARIGDLEQPTLRIWAEAFTAAEMDELVAFYNTDLGRKALAAMPQIAQASQALGMAWGQRVAQDAIAKHQQTIRQRGLRI